MNNYFNKNGTLTPEGKRLILHYTGAIDILFNTEECADLSMDELKVLQTNMLAYLNDKFARRLAHKQAIIDKLNQMSDQEFEAYLKEKYGSVWPLLTLSHEEYARVPVLSQEKIEQLLKEGAQRAAKVPRSGLKLPKKKLPFKKSR